MKKVIFFLMGAMLLAGSPQASAQNDTVAAEPQIVAVEDSGYNYNYAEDEAGNEVQDPAVPSVNHDLMDGISTFDRVFGDGSGLVICMIGIVFGAPTLLVLAILFFRYRNKQAKYRLAAKALENGQPIPDGLLGNYRGYTAYEQREQRSQQTASHAEQAAPQGAEQAAPQAAPVYKDFLSQLRYLYQNNLHMRKGLQQLFLGVGLLAFVSVAGWGNFFVGISFLVIFIALGQIVAAYLESGR
jgi:hypothetical protein